MVKLDFTSRHGGHDGRKAELMSYTYCLTRYENKVYRVDEEEMDINDGYDVWEKVPGVWRGLNHDEIDDFCGCDSIKIDESVAMRLIGQFYERSVIL